MMRPTLLALALTACTLPNSIGMGAPDQVVVTTPTSAASPPSGYFPCEKALRAAVDAAQGARQADAPAAARATALEAAEAALKACDGVHTANAEAARGLVMEFGGAR